MDSSIWSTKWRSRFRKQQNKASTLCCLEDSAFTLTSQRINAENDITYNNLKAALAEAFSGEDYKRTLETMLRNLRFTKGTNINLFCNSLRTLIRELYNLTELDD